MSESTESTASSFSAAWSRAERKFWLARSAPEMYEKAEVGEIDLSTGSPSFGVSPKVKDAIKARVDDLEPLSYPPANGGADLRAAIAEFDRRYLGAFYDADGVVITYGAMQALSNVIGAMTSPGDEVLLPAPFWFQFPNVVTYVKAEPKVVQTYPGNNFKLTPTLLANAITPRSRVLVLTNPNNPSGAIYTRDELAALVEVLKVNRNLVVASDEVYNLLIPGSSGLEPSPSLCSFEEIKDRVFVVNSMSKNFAMSGLRVGWIGGTDKAAIDRMTQRQRFVSLGVNLYLQAGALAGIRNTHGIVGDINKLLVGRRQKAADLLGSIPRVRFRLPEAAYYFWVDVRDYMGCRTREGKVIRNDEDLATYLKMEIDGQPGVSVVTGSSCAMPGYFRITYAVSEDLFAEGAKRMKARLAALVCG
ncbi:MAG: pyridoxal phosphate-dependent aminotransferase [Acidobacteriota bacterium]